MDSSLPRGSNSLRRSKAVAVLAACTLAGAVLWAWPSAKDRSPPAPSTLATAAPRPAPQQQPPAAAPSALSAASPDTTLSAASVPEGLTPQEWAELRQALADTPDAASELQRIARWLGFQRRGQRFQDALHRQDHGPEALALARQIDEEIDTHLAQGELSGPEALALKSAVLTELEPDARAREQALAAWRQAQVNKAGSAADPRDAAYLAAQAQVLSQWRGQTGQAPDQAALQSQLTQVRTHVYAASAPAP